MSIGLWDPGSPGTGHIIEKEGALFSSDDIIAYECDGYLYCPDCRQNEYDDSSFNPISFESYFDLSGEEVLYCSVCGNVIWFDGFRNLEEIF